MRNALTIAGLRCSPYSRPWPRVPVEAADPDGPAVRANKRGDVRFSAPVAFNPDHQSTIRIRESDGLPVHKALSWVATSPLLSNCRASCATSMCQSRDHDAVVQSSNRVYLIGKKVGQSNASSLTSMGSRCHSRSRHRSRHQCPGVVALAPDSRLDIKAEVLNERSF